MASNRLSLNLLILDTSYEWKHSIFVILYLAYFTQQNVFKVSIIFLAQGYAGVWASSALKLGSALLIMSSHFPVTSHFFSLKVTTAQETKERGLRRNQPYQHLDLGHPASMWWEDAFLLLKSPVRGPVLWQPELLQVFWLQRTLFSPIRNKLL